VPTTARTAVFAPPPPPLPFDEAFDCGELVRPDEPLPLRPDERLPPLDDFALDDFARDPFDREPDDVERDVDRDEVDRERLDADRDDDPFDELPPDRARVLLAPLPLPFEDARLFADELLELFADELRPLFEERVLASAITPSFPGGTDWGGEVRLPPATGE